MHYGGYSSAVEHRSVAPAVVGSNPTIRPKILPLVRSLLTSLTLTFLLGAASFGQDSTSHKTPPDKEPIIQDNSFLVEEAYNQNYGVVQHIQTFHRQWISHDWA